MKKLLALSSLAGFVSVAMAEDVKVVAQPEFWTPVKENVVNNDIPQYLGYLDKAPLVQTYAPDQVNEGLLGFLHHAETIANFVFASVILMAVLFGIFVLINGRAKLHHGFSGEMVDRWSAGDVALHWLVAIPCVFLILTGLVLGAGAHWFHDWMGPDHFHSLVSGSVMFHNFMAFPFAIGAVFMIVKWAKRQLPEKHDAKWFASLGGYINFGPFKGKHPDAGFANAGEKAFFWTFTIFGLLLIVSGFGLLYPEWFGGLSKTQGNLALVVHIISAIVLSAFSVVHIYMGSVMSEGGLENMLSGRCDKNWAIQNHNVWYDNEVAPKQSK